MRMRVGRRSFGGLLSFRVRRVQTICHCLLQRERILEVLRASGPSELLTQDDLMKFEACPIPS